MKITVRRDLRTWKHLLLFALYIAALWGVAWYNVRYYGGAYNTIITDLLLTAAFALTFFGSLIQWGAVRLKTALWTAALLCAAAMLALLLLQPHYTVADGYRILASAHYQHVQLMQQAVTANLHAPWAPAGILFEAEQNAQPHEILFDLASGTYAAIT